MKLLTLQCNTISFLSQFHAPISLIPLLIKVKDRKCDIEFTLQAICTWASNIPNPHLLTIFPVFCFILIRPLFAQRSVTTEDCNNNWHRDDSPISFVLIWHSSFSGSALTDKRDIRACFLTPPLENREGLDRKRRWSRLPLSRNR